MTEDQARAVGDWVAAKGRNLTDIFITHGHGDHWFAAGLLAERFGARVVASAGTIAQMHGSVAARPLLWDKLGDRTADLLGSSVSASSSRISRSCLVITAWPLMQRRHDRSAGSRLRPPRQGLT